MVKEFNKEYLETKIKTLEDQQSKVLRILEEYSDLYKKLDGALEITRGMLKDFDVVEDTK